MRKQTAPTLIKEAPPEFIRKAFPRTWYHPRWHLLTWYPRGVLNEAFADQVKHAGQSSSERIGMWANSDHANLVQPNDGFKTRNRFLGEGL